ncbi:MAG: GLPGLI family protein, partial [Ignavibacteria bacterium]|nr:GLPGLI family protein [Ignavibacteria bacterium]
MRKIFLFVVVFILPLPLFSQLKVVYGVKQNGEIINNDSVVVYFSDASVRILRQSLNKESHYIDFAGNYTVQFLDGNAGEMYCFRKNFTAETGETGKGTEKIDGYECIKTVLTIRSNKIEVWYTEDAGFKGGPGLYLAGIPGLVLKVIRNGSYELYARSIDKSESYIINSKIPESNYTETDEAGYQQKLIESRYETLNIFNKQIINFNNPEVQKGSEVLRFAKGNILVRKIKLPEYKGDRIVIAELRVKSKGDAYDRLGSVFAAPVNVKNNYVECLINGFETLPENANKGNSGISVSGNYYPPVELMRFITSFGAGHYNNSVLIKGYVWEDEIIYRQDISDIVNGMNGEYWVGVYTGNYDKGGHEVSLDLKIFNEEGFESSGGFMPLFNTVNMLESEGLAYNELFKGNNSLKCEFNLREEKKDVKLRFVTTGHGDDEFIKKENRIFLDGRQICSAIPWRTDCGTYRENNPASGNFPNGMSSSDYSRSNWCPGIVVSPYEIILGNLLPGKH